MTDVQPNESGTVASGNDSIALNLTEEEATRYDRQMRLWGIEAQQRWIIVLVTLSGL